jgi:hypothetical protein
MPFMGHDKAGDQESVLLKEEHFIEVKLLVTRCQYSIRFQLTAKWQFDH